ncbi:MAG: diguanylate cyclase [Burkholderiales bacterium]
MTSHTGFVVEQVSVSDVVGRAIGNFALPIAVLGVSFLLVGYLPELPDFFSVLRVYGPYVTLGVGLLVSLAFKRGRAVFAILSLMLAYGGFRVFLGGGADAFAAKTVYAALCIFVPFNLALLSVVRERGALNPYGARRLGLLVAEMGITAAIVLGDLQAFTESLYRPLFADAAAAASPIPQLGMATMAVALLVAVICAVVRASVIEAAFAVAVVAFAASCNGMVSSDVFAWLTTAGVIVTAAVLQDSYRLAFRDELTGLPGRRVLNERLMSLEGNYSIAMLDVDHFKAFNDTWGHDVGDQVLKLVASRLRRVGGGGKAYRYGGEEFTIVFLGRRVLEVLPRVEALRKDIEAYEMQIRAANHPRNAQAGTVRNAGDAAPVLISVRVSIGVAEKNDRHAAPDAVIKAADEALYRAKSAGRNRVSR